MGMPTGISKAIKDYGQLQKLNGILDYLYATKTVANYVHVAKAMGMFSGGAELGNLLGETQREDKEAKRPIRSSLVVGSETGIPGRGYFAHLRQLGFSIGATEDEELDFWVEQMQALKVQVPTP